jgi:hypothetical protein
MDSNANYNHILDSFLFISYLLEAVMFYVFPEMKRVRSLT